MKDGNSNQAVAQVFRGTRALGLGDGRHAAAAASASPARDRPRPRRDAERAGLRARQRRDPPGRARPARPRLRRLELRRDRRHREGRDLRLAGRARTRTRARRRRRCARSTPRSRRPPARASTSIASFGVYERVEAKSNVGIYGFYDPKDWSRKANPVIPKTDPATYIMGAPEGLLADKATGVVLQLLRDHAERPTCSSCRRA